LPPDDPAAARIVRIATATRSSRAPTLARIVQ
jgi:hypothetical protein